MKLQPKYFVLFSILILILLLLFTASCNTTEPPGNETFALKLEDVSSTEAWIQLTTNNIQLPTTINLLKNNSVSQIFNLSTKDSLLYIDSLLPNQTYKILATMQQGNNASNELSVTTPDTTSHNFTWQAFEFGQHSSSSLYDVAIINENDIWAVGEIYMNDSLGNPDPNAYNAIHWNGASWELKRIMFYTICGQQSRTPYPAKAIWAFNENDIWIAMDGDQIVKIENGIQTKTMCLPWSFVINKLWGSSSNDLYAVGNSGNIAHYQNGGWTKIESGTNTFIVNIWGVPDGNGNYNKYCANLDALLKIDVENTIQRINTERGHSVGSVWGKTDRLLYTAGGSGISLYKNYKWEKINEPTVNLVRTIRGQSYNDICGLIGYGSIIHFNGHNWQIITTSIDNINYRAEIKNDLIVAVGWLNESAQVTVLKRN